jgi:hypothetical protein
MNKPHGLTGKPSNFKGKGRTSKLFVPLTPGEKAKLTNKCQAKGLKTSVEVRRVLRENGLI